MCILGFLLSALVNFHGGPCILFTLVATVFFKMVSCFYYYFMFFLFNVSALCLEIFFKKTLFWPMRYCLVASPFLKSGVIWVSHEVEDATGLRLNYFDIVFKQDYYW